MSTSSGDDVESPRWGEAPEVEVEIRDGRDTPRSMHRISSLDMDRSEDYKLYMPNAGAGDNVITELDGVVAKNTTQGRARNYDSDEDIDPVTRLDLDAVRAAKRSVSSQKRNSKKVRHTRSDPKRVVRISPRAKKTFCSWKKFEQMYASDRDNNVNPLFMSSMNEYEDAWSRECKQRKASKKKNSAMKPWVVTPHHAAVAKRATMQAQTSVTGRGPYIPPHEAHRRFFYDKRKWLHGAWHIPAPSGSFTMRGEAFAAASAVTKGEKYHNTRKPTLSRKPLHGGHGPSVMLTTAKAAMKANGRGSNTRTKSKTGGKKGGTSIRSPRA